MSINPILVRLQLNLLWSGMGEMSGHLNFFSELFSLEIALTLVRGPGRQSALALRLAPLWLFFRPTTNQDRPARNQDRPPCLDFGQGGLNFWQGGLDFRQGGLDFWQVGKIIKVALSTALEQTAAQDLEPRSMLCLRRKFPTKKFISARHFKW